MYHILLDDVNAKLGREILKLVVGNRAFTKLITVIMLLLSFHECSTFMFHSSVDLEIDIAVK